MGDANPTSHWTRSCKELPGVAIADSAEEEADVMDEEVR
jgi:hypothetical protein